MQPLGLPIRSVAWCMVLCLSFIQAACTQDLQSSLESPAVTAIASASTNDATLPNPRTDTNDLTDLLVANQTPPAFSLFIGETNDDGLQDEISICEFNKICVTTL